MSEWILWRIQGNTITSIPSTHCSWQLLPYNTSGEIRIVTPPGRTRSTSLSTRFPTLSNSYIIPVMASEQMNFDSYQWLSYQIIFANHLRYQELLTYLTKKPDPAFLIYHPADAGPLAYWHMQCNLGSVKSESPRHRTVACQTVQSQWIPPNIHTDCPIEIMEKKINTLLLLGPSNGGKTLVARSLCDAFKSMGVYLQGINYSFFLESCINTRVIHHDKCVIVPQVMETYKRLMEGADTPVNRKNKTSQMMKRTPIHCICHRLALACIDTVKAVESIGKVALNLSQLWKFFDNSPKCTAASLKVQFNVIKGSNDI